MCTICTLWELGKLTAPEANKALFELILEDGISEEHASEVMDKIDG